MFGITIARTVPPARQAAQTLTLSTNGRHPTAAGASPNGAQYPSSSDQPTAMTPDPSHRRLIWRTHGSPPVWMETAA